MNTEPIKNNEDLFEKSFDKMNFEQNEEKQITESIANLKRTGAFSCPEELATIPFSLRMKPSIKKKVEYLKIRAIQEGEKKKSESSVVNGILEKALEKINIPKEYEKFLKT